MSAPVSTLAPLPSCADLPPARVCAESTPFVLGPHRLLSCPWEATRRNLDQGQTAIVEVVARTAATLAVTRIKPWDETIGITWIAADGSIISHDTVPLSWWRNRLAKHVTLEVQRA